MPHNPAKTLKDQIWGQDWINAIPAKFRSALKYLNLKTPGVDNSTVPDEIGVGGVINSQVVTNRINEREKTTSQLDGSVLQHVYHEQDYDETFDVIIPTSDYTTEEGAELGEPHKKIEGLVPGIDRVTTFDISAIETIFGAYQLVFPGTANLSSKFPDVLTEITPVFETSEGDGSYSDDVGNAAWAGHGSYNVPRRGSGEASAAIIADASVLINQPFFPAAPTTRVMFLLKAPVTRAQVLAKLETILGDPVIDWATFDPKPITIKCVSRRVAVRAEANWEIHDGGSIDSSECAYDTGGGFSTNSQITVKIIRVPPTLHGAISISSTNTSTASADASAGFFAIACSTLIGPKTVGPISLVAGGGVYCSAAATSVTTLPSSGLALLDCQPQPYKYGWVMFHTEVVDLSVL